MRRFQVVEESMLPALRPGDLVLAVSDPEPPFGSIVVLAHPEKPDMWLVKRLVAQSDGEAWVESDNPDVGTDSRSFGWTPAQSLYRVTWRVRHGLFARRIRPAG